MPHIVVEDGSGIEDANAYTPLEFFDVYHEDRGRDLSAFTDEQKEAALIRATDYVEKRFIRRWKGTRTTTTQALSFPRSFVFVDDQQLPGNAVPMALQQAVSEYALRALSLGELAPDGPLPFDRVDAEGNEMPGRGPIRNSTDIVGPINETRGYMEVADLPGPPRGSNTVAGWMIPAYPAADLLIEPLMRSVGNRTIRN